jgi:hypothetical protein
MADYYGTDNKIEHHDNDVFHDVEVNDEKLGQPQLEHGLLESANEGKFSSFILKDLNLRKL